MGVDFELPTVKHFMLKLVLFPELFLKIVIMILSVAGIVLMVEFGFNDVRPDVFCNDNGEFRFCINSIASNIVAILVSSALIFVDLVRACFTSAQWKRLTSGFIIIIVMPLSAYLLASSSLVLKNYINLCDSRSCSESERRFLSIPVIGFASSIFYLIIAFLSFLRVILSKDD